MTEMKMATGWLMNAEQVPLGYTGRRLNHVPDEKKKNYVLKSNM